MKLQLSSDFGIEYIPAGQGTPLVLLHAFPFTAEMWSPQLKEFADEYHVLAPSTRGFGCTDGWMGTPSLETAADDLEFFLERLNINEPIILCGLSMGGYIAQIFAHRYPLRLRALVLCATRAEQDTSETRVKRQEMIDFASNHSIEEIADKISANLLGKTTLKTRPDVEKEFKRIVATNTAQAVIEGTIALRDRPDMTGWLPDLQVPTLLVFGDEDPAALPEIMATLESGISNVKLKVIEGAGHMCNMEDPEAFNQALREFLSGL
jgi:pimeloyl-ACP methyl ester carboxylesterase